MIAQKRKTKSTFMLDARARMRLESEAIRTGLSQNEIVNCAVRNLKIVKIDYADDIIKNLYETRQECKQKKFEGIDVSRIEKNLDDTTTKLYKLFDESTYQKVKYNENVRKNKSDYRTKHCKSKKIAIK